MYSRLVTNLLRFPRNSLGVSYKIRIHSYATTWIRHRLDCGCRSHQYRTLLKVYYPAFQIDQNSFSARVAPKPNSLSTEVLLEKLYTYYEAHGYMGSDYLERLLTQLEAEPDTFNQLLTNEQMQFLLRGGGLLLPNKRPEERLEIFRRLWDYMARNGQLTTAAHFYTHLQVLKYNRGPLPEYGEFVEKIIKFDKSTNLEKVYTELLEVACSCGNMQQSSAILNQMRELKLSMGERQFNALILGHGRSGNLELCQTVVDSMAAAGVAATTETQTNLFMAYTENGVYEKAVELLQKFQRQFDTMQLLKMLRCVMELRNLEKELLVQVVGQLPDEFVMATELPVELRNLCVEALYNGRVDVVTTMLSSLPAPKFNDNQDRDTYGVFLLHTLFNSDEKKETIIDICRLLAESNKNERALHIAAEIATRRNPPMALPYFEALSKAESLRPHYFWPLMLYNFRRNGEAGIMHTLHHMKNMNVDCDLETLKEYILPRLSLTLDDPSEAVQRLDQAGLKPSQTLLAIVAHTLGQQKIRETLQMIERYPTKLDVTHLIVPLGKLAVNVRATQRYKLYTKLVAALAKKSIQPKVDFIGLLLIDMLQQHTIIRQDIRAINQFVDGMQKCGLFISGMANNTLQSLLQTNGGADKSDEDLSTVLKMLHKMIDRNLTLNNDVEDSSTATSSFIKHPRDMTYDELELHLIELESKGMNARGVLRRLLQVCVRDNRLKRALEVKAKCDALRIHISPGMLASIFDLYIKLKDLRQAQAALKNLQQTYPGFQIDEHKMLDYAALLVHEQRLEEAKELLSERAAKRRPVGGDYVLKNVWNLLTNVAQFAAADPTRDVESNLTRDAFAFLVKLGYCRPHNTVLGPIVRERLLRNDIRRAIDEFKALAQQYKHTPLQFELLSMLVKLSNSDATEMQKFAIGVDDAQEMLSQVTSVIAKVHGLTNMNSSLLLAIAESGTESQLRRLLINPEFRLNQEFLIKNCEHLGMSGAVRTLVRLARAARGLHHVLDEQSIYEMLLDKFTKLNDYEAAVDLFERLNADDELKISQDFLRKLVKLLQYNKIEIPSSIALRAQVI